MDTDLAALAKPMFELRLAKPPENPEELPMAIQRATGLIDGGRWKVVSGTLVAGSGSVRCSGGRDRLFTYLFPTAGCEKITSS